MRGKNPGNGAGRPEAGRSGEVRRRLLQVSRQLFADCGYQATSIKAIADAAEVNAAMVHYYFGNKEGLFAAVMAETLEPVIGRIKGLAEVTDIETFIEQFLDDYMKTLAANPWIPVLLAREVLLPEGRLRETFLRQVVAPVGGKIRRLIEGRRGKGGVDRGIDPTLATINLVSLAAFPFLAMPVIGKAFAVEFTDEFVERLSRHTARLYLQGLHRESP